MTKPSLDVPQAIVDGQNRPQMTVDEDGDPEPPSSKRHCKEGDLSGEVELGRSGKPKLSGEEYQQLKRKLKQDKAMKRTQPKFWLRDQGEGAMLAVEFDSRVPLFVADVQHLIMYSQLGHHSPYTPTRWCQVERFNRIKNTNVLIVENLSLYQFSSNEGRMEFLSGTFRNKIEIINPTVYSSNLVRDIINVPLTITQIKKFVNKYGTLENAVEQSIEVFNMVHDMFPGAKQSKSEELYKEDKFPRTHLLLSGWQMVEENFPLPIKGLMERKYKGYVMTKDRYTDVTPQSPMFGVDCEMCLTTVDMELTRISVVDEKYNTIYDEIVKPKNKIINYLTKFSGITPKLMSKVTKTLEDVQNDLRKLIPTDGILVGQSLTNDMHALKMMHPYIIDSSVCFNISGERSRKTKLQILAREFLNVRIQDSSSGHCSTEDSIASLKLVHLKLKKDLYFGDAVMSSVERQMKNHPQFGCPDYATSMLKQVTRMEKSASLVGDSDLVKVYQDYTFKQMEEKHDKKIAFFGEATSEEVVDRFCGNMDKYTLNVAHVRLDGEDDPAGFSRVDGWVKRMYESGVEPSLNVVIFGGLVNDGGNGCCFIQMKHAT